MVLSQITLFQKSEHSNFESAQLPVNSGLYRCSKLVLHLRIVSIAEDEHLTDSRVWFYVILISGLRSGVGTLRLVYYGKNHYGDFPASSD